MKKIPLIVVLGPTASGKTEIAIEIAKKYDGEIICADSMQIYKGAKIATAQPTDEEQEQIPHHLFSFKQIDEGFSVAEYKKLAEKAINDVDKRKKTAILCGGTGLYINSLTQNIEFSEYEKNDEIKKELSSIYEKEGKEKLFSMLLKLDPQEASTIDKDNAVRLLRALEVCILTNDTMTNYKRKNLEASSKYECLKIGIDYKQRAELYDKINKRVSLMYEMGLVEEARLIYNSINTKTALQAIGYKELFSYFDEKISLDEALDNIRQASRHYAKRQLSWFRRDKEINWFYKDKKTDFEEYKAAIFSICDDFLNF